MECKKFDEFVEKRTSILPNYAFLMYGSPDLTEFTTNIVSKVRKEKESRDWIIFGTLGNLSDRPAMKKNVFSVFGSFKNLVAAWQSTVTGKTISKMRKEICARRVI